MKHGTVTVVMNGINYEVTTYRVDGDYSDGRHPDSVEFTSNLQEDLLRRDFTINAMAYNHEFGFIDLYQGKEDLDRKLIRCVGDPNERFKEDALRMLRAIRFSAQLDFDIELQTYEAIKNNADLIQNVSFERIRDEITKIIMSDKPEKFLALYDTGLMEYVMPEFIPNIGCPQNSPWHKYTVDQHIMHTVMNVPNTFELRWTMLLHDIAKAKCRTTDSKGYDHFANHPIDGSIIAHDILQRFRFDNKSIRTIVRLIRYHDIAISLDEVKIRRTISTVGEDIFMQLLDVMDADDSAKAEVVWIESREKNKALRQIYQLFKERGYCLKKSQLAITGFDLQGIGIDEGKEMGELLDYLFQEVLVNPE
ncbi:MAG: HD domain-containing protein [Clostridia bacterium]|nr:HD domain-containing protein [Clostridia bacterium]